jgi:hypothetical protein
MNVLLQEIEQIQKKTFQSLDSDIRNAAFIGYNRESEVKNNWLVSLKLQEELYLLRRQLDQQKLKLTTDIKVIDSIVFIFFLFNIELINR